MYGPRLFRQRRQRRGKSSVPPYDAAALARSLPLHRNGARRIRVGPAPGEFRQKLLVAPPAREQLRPACSPSDQQINWMRSGGTMAENPVHAARCYSKGNTRRYSLVSAPKNRKRPDNATPPPPHSSLESSPLGEIPGKILTRHDLQAKSSKIGTYGERNRLVWPETGRRLLTTAFWGSLATDYWQLATVFWGLLATDYWQLTTAFWVLLATDYWQLATVRGPLATAFSRMFWESPGATSPHPSRPVYVPTSVTPRELITVQRDVPAGNSNAGKPCFHLAGTPP